MADFDNIQANDDFHLQALLMSKVVQRVLQQKGGIKIYGNPSLLKKPIVSFMKRIRVAGLNKFSEKTYISYINFFRKDDDLKKDAPVGAMVIYVPEFFVYNLMHQMEYPVDHEGDYTALEDATGAFCNLIAGSYKNGLKQMGYEELVMSHFSTAINDVFDGVPYDGQAEELYEISFELRGGEKGLVVDLSMGPIENEKGGFLDVYLK